MACAATYLLLASLNRLAVGAFVTANVLRLFGARAQLGRLFTDEETTVGTAARVAVLSHAVWTSRFGADSGLVGRTLVLNGIPQQVIGVLGAEYQDPFGPTEVWLPMTSAPNPAWLTREGAAFWAVGRMRPGLTAAEASADLSRIAAKLAAEFPESNAGMGIALQPLRDSLVGEIRPALLILLGFVALILLIACANIANRMGDAGAHVVVIQPDPRRTEMLHPFARLLDQPSHRHHAGVTGCAARLVRELDRPDHLAALAAEAAVLEILVVLGRLEMDAERAPPRWLLRARELVHARFRAPLRIGEVAREVDVHPGHLARAFRQHFRTPLGSYVRSLRLEWVAAKLTGSEESLASIALNAGFADQSHLTRAFKSLTGLMSQAYRRARANGFVSRHPSTSLHLPRPSAASRAGSAPAPG